MHYIGKYIGFTCRDRDGNNFDYFGKINKVMYTYNGIHNHYFLEIQPTCWIRASNFIMFYVFILPAEQVFEDENDIDIIAIHSNNLKLKIFQCEDLVRLICSFCNIFL